MRLRENLVIESGSAWDSATSGSAIVPSAGRFRHSNGPDACHQAHHRLCTFAFFLHNKWVKHSAVTLSDFVPLPMYWLMKPAQRRVRPRESNSVEEESEACIWLWLRIIYEHPVNTGRRWRLKSVLLSFKIFPK